MVLNSDLSVTNAWLYHVAPRGGEATAALVSRCSLGGGSDYLTMACGATLSLSASSTSIILVKVGGYGAPINFRAFTVNGLTVFAPTTLELGGRTVLIVPANTSTNESATLIISLGSDLSVRKATLIRNDLTWVEPTPLSRDKALIVGIPYTVIIDSNGNVVSAARTNETLIPNTAIATKNNTLYLTTTAPTQDAVTIAKQPTNKATQPPLATPTQTKPQATNAKNLIQTTTKYSLTATTITTPIKTKNITNQITTQPLQTTTAKTTQPPT